MTSKERLDTTLSLEAFATDYRSRMERLNEYLREERKVEEKYERRLVHLERCVEGLENIIEGMRIKAGLLSSPDNTSPLA